MKNYDIYRFFRKIRVIHTTIVAIMVAVLLGILLYTYFGQALFPELTDNFYILIILSLLNILVVFMTVSYVRRRMYKIKPEKRKLFFKLNYCRKCYFFQSFILSVTILINGIAFGLLQNNIYFIETIALMVFLSSIYPSASKFINDTNLTEKELEQIEK